VDPLASLQVEERAKCAKVRHQVKKNGDYVGYISQEPRHTQVFWGSTKPSMEASDSLQT
jgi:hypothetical protein